MVCNDALGLKHDIIKTHLELPLTNLSISVTRVSYNNNEDHNSYFVADHVAVTNCERCSELYCPRCTFAFSNAVLMLELWQIKQKTFADVQRVMEGVGVILGVSFDIMCCPVWIDYGLTISRSILLFNITVFTPFSVVGCVVSLLFTQQQCIYCYVSVIDGVLCNKTINSFGCVFCFQKPVLDQLYKITVMEEVCN